MHDVPLKAKVPAILTHVQQVLADRYDESRDQLEIYNGNLTQYIEDSIKLEVTNSKALAQTIARIVPVNTLRQVVNKLGKAYSNPVLRTASIDEDQDFVDFYKNILQLDFKMDFSTKIFNLHGYCGLEVYLDNNNIPTLRVLDATNFYPYSDDITDPTNMTVAVRWVDRVSKVDTVDDRDRSRTVDIFFLYSDTEFLIIDSDGDIRNDLMEHFGVKEGEHNLGIIPIIYISQSQSFLIPTQDTEKRQTAINISKLLTDLNYASLYLSHSKFFGIDVEAPSLEAGPDSMSLFTSLAGKDDGATSPQVGQLEPKINIEETIKLVTTELALHLTTQGLSAGQMDTGSSTTAQVSSGVAKMIDNADATDTIGTQQKIFKSAEERGLWILIVKLHNRWVNANLIDFSKGVSEDLLVRVDFEKKKTFESPVVITDRTIKLLEAGLITKRRAIKFVMPELDDKDITAMLVELDDESTGSGHLDNDEEENK